MPKEIFNQTYSDGTRVSIEETEVDEWEGEYRYLAVYVNGDCIAKFGKPMSVLIEGNIDTHGSTNRAP
jgi:hypothetical protein